MNAKKLILLTTAVLLAVTSTCLADDKKKDKDSKAEKFLVRPESHYHGKTYSQWLEQWWTWLASIPGTIDKCPFYDVTGANSGANQNGAVFFLSKSWAYDGLPLVNGQRPPAEKRYAKVPKGKAILVPFDGIVELPAPWNSYHPDPKTIAADNLMYLTSWAPFGCVLEIDGVAVPIDSSLTSPYLISTSVMALSVPAGSSFAEAFGFPMATSLYPVHGIEYMAIVKPLSVGEHTIRVRGSDSWKGFADSWVSDIEWHITVTKSKGDHHDGDDDDDDDDKGKKDRD